MRDRIQVIARATFFEAVRDRVLFVVLIFAIGVVLFSRVLGWLSVDDEMKMVEDFSLSGLSVLGLLLAMLVGAFALAKEIERRTLYSLLSRDLKRSELVVGKYLGLVAAFWAALIAAALVLGLWLILWGGRPGMSFVAAVAGLLCEALLVTAVALFLGALTAPPLAAMGTCAFVVAAHSAEALRELVSDGKSPTFAAVWSVLYKLMPNLEDVNFINATSTTLPVRWDHLGMGAAAMLLWSAIFVGGAILLFRRREV
jgi:ABC-type transport system involved in multi-copper enzyme maturation permease subunit